MTEQERLSREALLRRAAAAAGAVYVAPVLTSSAAAETGGICGGVCRQGRKARKRCRRRGGRTCTCVEGECFCGQDERCGTQEPCEQLHVCDENGRCACFVVAGSGGKTECVYDPGTRFCADYEPCDKETGLGWSLTSARSV